MLNTAAPDPLAHFDLIADKFEVVRAQISRIVIGQPETIDEVLVSILAGGHGLLVGVPGLGKTLLVKTVAHVLGLSTARIQCTPDLMPSDVTGTEILETDASGARRFRFVEGPAFAQLLMVDEINRASPKTQSALLEAMQENAVTVGGHTHKLPQPFHVLATQNPIEQEGTYPLPEAQLDRFLLQINMGYPDADAEKKMVLETTGSVGKQAQVALLPAELVSAQKLVRDLPVGEKVLDALMHLVRRARPEDADAPDIVREHVLWAPGPRAAQALMLVIRARALLDGRTTPSVDDVLALAAPVLRHRMRLRPRAMSSGISVETLIGSLAAGL